MNKLVLLAVALVALCYFGGNYCPVVLKKNKKMLLGVVVGLVLCSFFGIEGLVEVDDVAPETEESPEVCAGFDFPCKFRKATGR